MADPYNNNLFSARDNREFKSEYAANKELAKSRKQDNYLNNALAEIAGGLSRKQWSK